MRVAFYLDLEEGVGLARRSIRQAQKFGEVILLTDKKFRAEFDVEVRRYDLPECFYGFKRCYAHSKVEGECLFLDIDCFLLKDVSRVFKHDFDAAVCLRHAQISSEMPFNGGVVFSRSPGFWAEVAGSPDDHKDWRDTETRFSSIARSSKYNIRVLDGREYNYMPEKEEDYSCSIVHFKGWRKKLLTGTKLLELN